MSILTWLFGSRLDAPGVYRIRNRKNGMVYIGSTQRTIRVRMAEHVTRLHGRTHPNALLQSDWDQYGQQAFAFEVMENVNADQAEARELYWQLRVPVERLYIRRFAMPIEVVRQRKAQHQQDFAILIDALILLGWTDEDFKRVFKARVAGMASERRVTIDVTDERPLRWLKEHSPPSY